MPKYDAVVVGSGPNGLAAAITLAQQQLSVLLIEGKETIGGGMRSTELTLPGYTHDLCSAIHPLGIASPFFRSLPLNNYGLEWIQPDIPLAHPWKDGTAISLDRSLDKTADSLGEDKKIYKSLFEPLVSRWEDLSVDVLSPLHFPKHLGSFLRFGYYGIWSAERLANVYFKNPKSRALFAGLAAHAILPLDKYFTSAFGLILGILAHKVGWPMARGGSQNITIALASFFQSLGGEIVTNTMIEKYEDIPPAKYIFLDVTPRQLIKIAGSRLPSCYINRLKKYRYGPGVCKIDWALSEPIPWKALECKKAGTVHLGGTLEEIAHSEKKIWEGQIQEKNFIILAQPTLFDSTRAPKDKHIAWAYCHVPNRSTVDMSEYIETQIEVSAPGFKQCILAKNVKTTVDLEKDNPNYIGGDINGGAEDIWQLFTRPVTRIVPYSTPIKNLYICSSSTPPGGGVHGMCGFHAAKAALRTCSKS